MWYLLSLHPEAEQKLHESGQFWGEITNRTGRPNLSYVEKVSPDPCGLSTLVLGYQATQECGLGG